MVVPYLLMALRRERGGGENVGDHVDKVEDGPALEKRGVYLDSVVESQVA